MHDSTLTTATTDADPGLVRGLSVRHIQFMALGSAIGTGLFYGSASAIQAAGPIVLVAYTAKRYLATSIFEQTFKVAKLRLPRFRGQLKGRFTPAISWR